MVAKSYATKTDDDDDDERDDEFFFFIDVFHFLFSPFNLFLCKVEFTFFTYTFFIFYIYCRVFRGTKIKKN